MKSFPHLFNQCRTGDETKICSIHHWTSKNESTPTWWNCSKSIICLLCLHMLLPDIILDHNWHHATSNRVMNVAQIFKTLKSSNFKDFKNSISFNLVTRLCKHKNKHRLKSKNIYIYFIHHMWANWLLFCHIKIVGYCHLSSNLTKRTMTQAHRLNKYLQIHIL